MNTERDENKFEQLTEAFPGWMFNIGPATFLLNIAKSGCWARQHADGKQRETDWIAIRTKSDFLGEHDNKRTLHELIIGPFLIIFAWIPN